MANLVFISATMVMIVVLTIFVIAMSIGLYLTSRRRRHQARLEKVLPPPPAIDFTLRVARGFNVQRRADLIKSNTLGRIDRRSVESFYWMPASGTLPRPYYDNLAHSASTLSKSTNDSVFFVWKNHLYL